jgi:phosphatidylinositol-3-phosphatase
MNTKHLVRWISTALFIVIGCLATAASYARERHGDEVITAANRVRHVFIIVFENKNYSDTFGTSTQDPYLLKTLLPMGALLTEYYGTGHVSLDNYLSLISGQAPTQDTDDDCVPGLTGIANGGGNFTDVVEVGRAPQGQIVANGGCVYPAHVKTLANQLSDAGMSWKGYMEDMGNDPARESATCGHPQIGVGMDKTNSAEAPSAAVPLGDAYATRHDPFVYFHSIIDYPASCNRQVVNLSVLDADLQEKHTTPNLAFITPNLCNDGHDGDGTGSPGKTCNNGQPGSLTSIDGFLRTWVPKIMNSPAYKQDGLLIITFDESTYATTTTSTHAGQSIVNITYAGLTCCAQRPGPNLEGIRPGTVSLLNTDTRHVNLNFDSFGGDRIGAVLLSPFIKPGSSSDTPYNHYSMLRSLENIFGLREHLGYAADDPATNYYLNTIGNDKRVFEQASGPWLNLRGPRQ